MIEQARSYGLNAKTLYIASAVSVLLSILAWLFQKGDDRASAERFGIFVGLWAPTVLMLGKVFQDAE